MTNIALINTKTGNVVKIVSVKDDSVASEVVTATRQAVAGINPDLNVLVKNDNGFNRNAAIAEIMKCAVEYSMPVKR